MTSMSAHEIPVLVGFRQSTITFNGSAPVRAWLTNPVRPGELAAVVPHLDLITMINQENHLGINFSTSGAHLSRPDGDQVLLPHVFIEGVGLKCYDLRQAKLPIFEEVSLPAAA